MSEKRVYADRAEYLKHAVSKRRNRLKEMTVDYRGGKCIFCGYSKCPQALDFHHIDESAKGLTKSWSKIKQEADKCVLVCANCHRELHAGVVQLPQEIVVEK